MRTELNLDITKEGFDDTVSGILNRLEYRRLRGGDFEIVNKIKDYIKELIENILEKLLGNAEAVNITDRTAYIILAVCLIIIGAVIILLVLRISGIIDKNNKVRELFGTVIDKETSPKDLMLKSREYGKSGDYRNAVKFSFIALLLIMHDKNIIFLDEAKTNSEIVWALKNNNFKLISLFENLTGQFNALWYGHKHMTEESYALWENNSLLLWEGVQNEEKDR